MKMNIKWKTFSFLLLISYGCTAQETCKPGRGVKTPAGELIITRCIDQEKFPTRKYVSVDGMKLLESKSIHEESHDRDNARWIFRGDSLQETGCPDRLFLIDLSIKPIRTIAFGVKKACNVFQEAAWGEKSSVIIIQSNVKFIYEGGQMKLPVAGEKLWRSIEPPHAGTGLDLENAKAFAEDIRRP